MSSLKMATGLAAVVVAMGITGTAAAQQGTDIETFTCESINNRHNECRYRSTGVVTVHVQRQLSSTRCVYDQNWGAFDGGVWVDQGCRAEFVVRRPPGYGAPSSGPDMRMTCESKNNSYKVCRVDGIDPRSVRLERTLSSAPCTRGTSWGVSEGENAPPGIWVDRGCRATFAYATWDSSSHSDDSYGAAQRMDMTCESKNNSYKMCRVDNIDPRSARLERTLSSAPCTRGTSWGVSEGENAPPGIWVDRGCRGKFSYATRAGSSHHHGSSLRDYQLDCISEMSEWRHCDVPQVNRAHVELISGNNQCQTYNAWGTDDSGIWVRNNCMGTFRVNYHR